jgi:hypothetical protein
MKILETELRAKKPTFLRHTTPLLRRKGENNYRIDCTDAFHYITQCVDRNSQVVGLQAMISGRDEGFVKADLKLSCAFSSFGKTFDLSTPASISYFIRYYLKLEATLAEWEIIDE